MNKEVFWKKVLNQLKKTFSRPIFQTWFAQTKIETIKENKIVILCPSKFVKDTIEKRYFPLLKKTVEDVFGEKVRLSFKVSPSLLSKKEKKIPLGPLFEKEKPIPKTDSLGLRPEFTFANFAVSSTNELAYAAATAVAKSPGKAYNPLFLYGGVGVGKTHLMQAIGHEISKNLPRLKIIYCPSEDFTNELITAIQTKTTRSFKSKYRNVDVLLVDDIQFIAGKSTIQEEFFHTFNSIQRKGGQIVLTSDKPPGEIKKLEARLCSRFEGGLIIDIQPPDFELRTAILLIKARQLKINLSIEIAKKIAANIESTRKLEGFLIRLKTETMVKRIPITLELVNKLLGEPKEEGVVKKIKPQEILRSVAKVNKVRIADIKGPVRRKKLVESRHISMYLHRTLLNMTFMEIGKIHGGRDHTTVIHAIEKIANTLPSSEELREKISQVKNVLYG